MDTTTPAGTGDPAATLEGIRERAEAARTAHSLTKDWANGRSAADVPVLLGIVDATLALVADWDAERARIEPSGADAIQPAKPGNYLVSGRTGALEDCAGELREALRSRLSGEMPDHG
jgi:hypothetical protein